MKPNPCRWTLTIATLAGVFISIPALPSQKSVIHPGDPGKHTSTAKTLAGFVTPIDWSRFKSEPRDSRSLRQCRDLLRNCARYDLGWIAKTFKEDASGRMFVLTRMDEHGIRPCTSTVYGLAAVLETQSFDERDAGVSRQEALDRTIKLLRGTAKTHKAIGDPKNGWGDAWQSALWAAELGFGGWMLWEHLDGQTRDELTRLVVHEADRFIGYEVPYWNGKGGDTKAEENSWNSMVLSVAVAMMPGHPHIRQWKEKCSELMVSSYATENDWRENKRMLDGRAVKDWLKGYNALEGGGVLNHGFIHPDYMVDVSMNLWAYLTQSLAARPVPEAADFNAAMIYRMLATRQWPCPPYHEPGGTIYRPGQAGIYYPKGTDWSTHDVSAYYRIDVWADLLGWDKDLPYRAASWMQLRAENMLEMQRRHEDRRMFAKGEYDTYPGAEQWVTWCITDAYLALWLNAHNAMSDRSNWRRQS
ncbi:MAG: hypothetical protein JXQ73_20645 [Phycisphaerae bacterium]|nr:hypothetical protein [Phycisphaerae bacterium]